jgi:hypothetical protein
MIGDLIRLVIVGNNMHMLLLYVIILIVVSNIKVVSYVVYVFIN